MSRNLPWFSCRFNVEIEKIDTVREPINGHVTVTVNNTINIMILSIICSDPSTYARPLQERRWRWSRVSDSFICIHEYCMVFWRASAVQPVCLLLSLRTRHLCLLRLQYSLRPFRKALRKSQKQSSTRGWNYIDTQTSSAPLILTRSFLTIRSSIPISNSFNS